MKVIQNYELTLGFVKKKIIGMLKNILLYKAKQTMLTRQNYKKSLCILEDGTSSVQVGDIEQVTI
jgi:hypothetical protein